MDLLCTCLEARGGGGPFVDLELGPDWRLVDPLSTPLDARRTCESNCNLFDLGASLPSRTLANLCRNSAEGSEKYRSISAKTNFSSRILAVKCS